MIAMFFFSREVVEDAVVAWFQSVSTETDLRREMQSVQQSINAIIIIIVIIIQFRQRHRSRLWWRKVQN